MRILEGCTLGEFLHEHELSSEPWYLRHKDALTLTTAVLAAAAALASSLAGILT